MESGFPLKVALVLLTLSGLNPRRQNLAVKWCTCFCVVTTAPLVLIKMFGHVKNVDVLAPTFESMMTYYQISIRWLTFTINRKQYLSLLDAMDANFWPTQTHRDAKFAQEIKQLSQIFKWWCCIFIGVGGFGCVCFAIRPFFSSAKRQLPLLCWLPEDNTLPYYEIVYLVQIYVLFEATTVVGGFDVYFVGVILRYTIQFKLLRYELEHLVGYDDQETEKKIKIYVKYHNILLRQMTTFLKACSLFLLNQYFAFIVTLCMELYILTETSKDQTKIFNCLIYICLITLQAAVICVPPTILQDETSQVSTSIYLSEWYNTRNFGKTILLTLTTAHRPITFYAGGLFAINVQSLTNILNAGISFYTLMKNRKQLAFNAE